MEDQACLEEIATGERKALQRNEVLVLSQLLRHRGETLSKHRLSCGSGETPIIRESAVVKAICTLRQALGEPEASYIHTVPKEGYQLVVEELPEVQTDSPLMPCAMGVDRPRVTPAWQLMVVGGLMAALFWMLSAQWSSSPLTQRSSQISNESGQSMRVIITTSSQSNLKEVTDYADSLTGHLSSCVYFPWDEIHLALSHDRQLLNVTLVRQGQSGEVRNIKISDFRIHPRFIDPQWLKREFDCD